MLWHFITDLWLCDWSIDVNFWVDEQNVLSISKQLDYFRHYKIHLRNLVGTKEAEEIVQNALYILSLGTNDFLQNYYVEPTRSKQYNIERYMNYLISCMRTAIKVSWHNARNSNIGYIEIRAVLLIYILIVFFVFLASLLQTMHSLGARKLVVVGVPPFGCMPLVRTFRDDIKCDTELNKVAFSFNSKIQRELKSLEGSSLRSVFLDIYSIILNAIDNPKRYG